MRASQLEAVVLAAIDALRSGKGSEDDRIEFKRDWPGADKARQLAGAANQARGDYLIYVIGIDERDGTVHAFTSTEPATWWSQIESAFDEVAPELMRHLNIQASDGEHVIALLFRTDRPPYVVKVSNGGATEREVPIRSGTRTRSARRHELVRLLYPTAAVPQIYALTGLLTLGPPEYLGGDSERVVHMELSAQVYFEHVYGEPAFLPLHTAYAEATSGEIVELGKIHFRSKDGVPAGTVHPRWDGVQLSGPGSAYTRAHWSFPRDRLDELGAVEEWRVRLVFPVAGTERQAVVTLAYANPKKEVSERRASDEYTWDFVPPTSTP
jgi:hypothetical protein